MTFNKCSIKGKVYGNTPENQQGGGRGSEMDEVKKSVFVFKTYIHSRELKLHKYLRNGST